MGEITRRTADGGSRMSTIYSQHPQTLNTMKHNSRSLPILKRSQRKKRFRIRRSGTAWIISALAALVLVIIIFVAFFLRGMHTSEDAISPKFQFIHKDHLRDEVTLSELREARESLLQAKSHRIAPLRQMDREKYTVRINTWHRNEQLIASIEHLRTCPNIAQIQVIWCDGIHSPPPILSQYAGGEVPVVIEHHEINSLNERFRVLDDTGTPTYGVLSVDDDVLRPCEAMDAGFYRWIDHPDRIVGYDTRLHVASIDGEKGNYGMDAEVIRVDTNPRWKYGYLSSSKAMNQYSITLPRFCFMHRNYLDLYMQYAPKRILQTIDAKFNCEDIGMSFFVSALTNGRPPLLADLWATMPMMVKLYSESTISGGNDHKHIRDDCVDKFGFLLGLKDGYSLIGEGLDHEHWGTLEFEEIMHGRGSFFGIGADHVAQQEQFLIQDDFTSSRKQHLLEIRSWVEDREHSSNRFPFEDKKIALMSKMMSLGLIEGTPEWESKFGNH